jgi:tetratricopeptide (TPR) repeat protein
MAQIYNNLGLAYADLPDWTRSEECLRKSLDIKAKAGDTLGQANALNNLARVQESRDDLTAAIDSSTQAIALFIDMRDFYTAAVVKHERGKRFRRMNERQSAARDFAEASNEFRALGKTVAADAAARDLLASADTGGLPWWVWGVIVILIVCVLVLIIGLAVG